MAVAVKNSPETGTRFPLGRLALGSWVGVAYLLVSLAVVFYGLPALWGLAVSPWLKAVGGAVDVALLIVVMVAAAAGLVVAGYRLAGPHPPHGIKAGIFVGFVEVLAAFLITCGVGTLLEGWLGEGGRAAGAALTGVLGVALLAAAVWSFTRPAVERVVIQLEDQGWFTAAPYKRSQGQKVRRGTILGILILAGCGVWTLLHHNTLATGSPHWQVTVPFTGTAVTLLPDVQFTVPLLLAAASLWLAYRVVSLPVFADFLIATEAEMNKVSWTTRPRLIQDTIVVLVTVILLTVFLFAVDQLWSQVLTRIGVIQTPPASQAEGPKEQPW